MSARYQCGVSGQFLTGKLEDFGKPTAVHGPKPIARRDVGEVACGQVAVGLETVLHPEALYHIAVSGISIVYVLAKPRYLVSFSTPQPTLCKKGKVTFFGGGESGDANAAPSLTVFPRIRGHVC